MSPKITALLLAIVAVFAAPALAQTHCYNPGLGPLYPLPLACPCGDECDCGICTCGVKLPRGLVDQPFKLVSYADAKAAGPIRTAARRIELRTWLTKRAFFSRDANEKAAIRNVLSDRDSFDVLFESLQAEHDSLSGGKVTDFLDWFLAHADQIIALIQRLFPANVAHLNAADIRAAVHAEFSPPIVITIPVTANVAPQTCKSRDECSPQAHHAAPHAAGPFASRPVLNWFATHKPLRRVASPPFRAVKAAAGRVRCRC